MGVAIGGLLGCSQTTTDKGSCARSLQTESASSGVGTWITVAEPLLDTDGISEEVLVHGSSGPLTLRISAPSDATACVQLHSVNDAASSAWVTAPTLIADYGDYCVSCPQRVSVGTAGAVYVLPSIDPAPPVTSVMKVRAALRDCSTFLPYRSATGRPDRLRVETLSATPLASSARGEVLLEFVITPGSFLYSDDRELPTVLAEAVAQINVILQPGSLSVVTQRVRRTTIDDPLELTRGDVSAITSVVDSLRSCVIEGATPRSRVLPVVLAGCIRKRDPILMTISEPEGYVPHIPDGVIADQGAYGVYLRGRTCTSGSTPFALTSGDLAKRIAHELGHALGLYHTVEQDGTTDQLTDTGTDNLMNYRPSVVAGLGNGFTTSQLQVMRRHPLIRAAP